MAERTRQYVLLGLPQPRTLSRVKTMVQLAWFGLAILGVSLLGVADDIIRHGIPLLLVLCLLPVAFWLGRRSRGQNLILASRIRYRRARHYGRITP